MELEKTVEKDDENERGEEEVVGDWNEGERPKEETVRGYRRRPIQIHGSGELTEEHHRLFNSNSTMLVSYSFYVRSEEERKRKRRVPYCKEEWRVKLATIPRLPRDPMPCIVHAVVFYFT